MRVVETERHRARPQRETAGVAVAQRWQGLQHQRALAGQGRIRSLPGGVAHLHRLRRNVGAGGDTGHGVQAAHHGRVQHQTLAHGGGWRIRIGNGSRRPVGPVLLARKVDARVALQRQRRYALHGAQQVPRQHGGQRVSGCAVTHHNAPRAQRQRIVLQTGTAVQPEQAGGIQRQLGTGQHRSGTDAQVAACQRGTGALQADCIGADHRNRPIPHAGKRALAQCGGTAGRHTGAGCQHN